MSAEILRWENQILSKKRSWS